MTPTEAIEVLAGAVEHVPGKAWRSQAIAALREVVEDTARLDWLEGECCGCVRGTDIRRWCVEALDERNRNLRAAIDAARKGAK